MMHKPINKLLAPWALCLFLSFSFLQKDGSIAATQYCNNRFGYCLNYPSSLFPDRTLSVQSDTLLLKSVGQIAEVKVIGKLGATKEAPEAIFEKNLQAISSKSGKANVISTLFGEDFYEANFLCGDFTYHQKANFSPTAAVLLTITVPMNRPEMMVRAKSDIEIVFE